MSRPRARAALATALLALACSEGPHTPVPRGGADSAVQVPMARLGVATVGAAPGASVAVPVEVPAAFRWAPFDVPRTLTVPPGFAPSVHTRLVGARFLAVAPNGDLFASQPSTGRVVLVRPGAVGATPTQHVWASGLRRPHDVVFHTIGGTTWVYVAETHRVVRYAYTPGATTAPAPQVVVAGLPDASTPELQGGYGHALKNIALAGDRLYVSIASTCNVCTSDTQSDPVRASVYVYPAAGGAGRLFARGLRNAEGLAVIPGTTELWVVVNNRDNIAYPRHGDITGDGQDDYGRVVQSYVDNHPPEAFTRVRDGGNYGWPFCNPTPDSPSGMDDPPFERDVQTNPAGAALDCAAADRITKGIQAHSAPLGLTFLQGTNAPAAYRAGVVVALHGSWNRSSKTGYKVIHFPWDATTRRPGTQTDLVTGWATATTQWGRPVDVAVDHDGSLLISDDYSGTIYRLRATASPTPGTPITGPLVSAAGFGCLAGGPSAGLVHLVPCSATATNQRWTTAAVGTPGRASTHGGVACATASGSLVIAQACSGSATAQQWTHTAAGELKSQLGACVTGFRTSTSAWVQLQACSGSAAQRWTR